MRVENMNDMRRFAIYLASIPAIEAIDIKLCDIERSRCILLEVHGIFHFEHCFSNDHVLIRMLVRLLDL